MSLVGYTKEGVDALVRFEAPLSLYNRNAATVAKVRQARAKARSGGVGSIWALTASLGVGYFGTAAYFDPGRYGPPAVLRSRLLESLPSAGSGWLPVGGQSLTDGDARFTYNNVATANYGAYWLQINPGGSITFAAGEHDGGDAVEALLSDASTGTLTVEVNGVAGPAFTPRNQFSWQKYTANLGIAPGQTVTFTQGPSGVSYVGVMRTRATAGISVSALGRSGAQSADFVQSSGITVPGGMLTPATVGETPDVLIFGLDTFVNDAFANVPIAQSKANAQAVISQWQGAGTGVVLWLPYPAGLPSAQSAAIAAAAHQLADANGLLLIDGQDRLPYAEAVALGYVGPDELHQTESGYAETGEHWFQAA